MFIELVSSLRCPRPHDETWLVASSTAMRGRHLYEGVLGCPVCLAEFPVQGGVAMFSARAGPDAAAIEPGPDEVLRLAALLGAGDAGLFVLCGAWCAHAVALVEATGAQCLAVDGPAPAAEHERLSVLRSDGAIPLAAGSARGVAVDGATPGDVRLASAVRALAAGGRLVAPASAAVPDGVRELARDDRHWVAERTRDAAVSAPISLGRARRG